MYVCRPIYAGERRDAAKFVWGDRGERVKPRDFVDTGEHRLIQGILGSSSEIGLSLVEIDLENDQIQGRFLCCLVDYLQKDIDILIGNDLPHVLPLQIAEFKTTEHAMTYTRHDIHAQCISCSSY